MSVGAYLANQIPWLGAVLAELVCLAGAALRLRSCFREYGHNIEKLNGHLQNLEKGQPAPSLKDLIEE